MTFPDNLSGPSRTIITGEGGISPSRFKHVVEFKPTKSQAANLKLNSKKHISVVKKLGLSEDCWLRKIITCRIRKTESIP